MGDTPQIPTERVYDLDSEGRVVLRRPHEGEVERLRRAGTADRLVTTGDLADVQSQEIGSLLNQQEGGGGGQALTAAEAIANAATMGGYSAALRRVSPETYVRSEARAELSPVTNTAAGIGGAIVMAALSGGESVLAEAAGATGPGIAAGLGRSATSALTRFLGARAAGVAGAAVEGGAISAIAGLENSVIHNRPESGEQYVADIGMGALMGLGIGGAAAGGGALLSRSRSAAARALQGSVERAGLGEGARWYDPYIERGLRVASRFGMVNENTYALASGAERRLASEGAARMQTTVRTTTDLLNSTISEMGADSVERASARSRRVAELIDAMPGEPARAGGYRSATGAFRRRMTGAQQFRSALTEELDSIQMAIAHTVRNETDASILSTANRAHSVINAAHEALGTAANTADAVSILESASNSLRSIAPARTTGPTAAAVAQLRGAIDGGWNSLDALLTNPNIADMSALANARRIDANEATLRTSILREFGNDVVEGGLRERTVDGEKLTRMFREAGNATSDRRFSLINDYLEAVGERRALDEQLYGIQNRASRAAEVQLRKDLEHGRESFRANANMRSALTNERQEAGFSIVAGINGAAIGGALGGGLGAVIGGPVGGVIGAGVGTVAGLGASAMMRSASFLALLANVERGVSRSEAARASGVSTLRRSLTASSGRVSRASGTVTRALPVITGRLASKEHRREEYNAVISDIRGLAANPQELENRVVGIAGELNQGLPEMFNQVSGVSLRAVSYLAQSLPPESQDVNLFPQDSELEPSLSEIDSFMRKMHALENPYILYDHAADFSLTNEEVEAVSTVFPLVYQQIVADTTDVLAGIDEMPSYQARMQVGTLLRIPSVPTLQPDFLAAMQSTAAQTPQQHQAQRGISTSYSVSAAGDTFSESQSLEQRF